MKYLKYIDSRYKLFFLLVFFIPGVASADDMFTPVAGDYFQNFISEYVQYLYPAIFLINTVIMLYATSQFFYNFLMGTIFTANEGVIMGKGWNTSNMVLRFIFVTLFLLPYAQYNNTQVVVMWVAKMGSGLADKVITLEKVDQSVDPLKVFPSTIKAQELARALLESQVCMLTYNYNLDVRNSKTKFDMAKDQNKMSAINYKSKDGKYTVYDFGLNTEETTDGSWFRDINPNDNGNVCGQIQFTVKDTSKSGKMDTLINAVAISNAVYTAKTAAFNTMFSSSKSLASKYVGQNYTKETLATDIDSLASAYVQSVSQAATTALSDNTNTATESAIDDLGWVMAATKSTRDIMKHFIVDQEVTAFPFAKGVIDLRNLTNLQKDNFKGIDTFRTTQKQALHLLSGRTDPVLYADSEANSDISPESATDKIMSAYSFNPRPEYTNEINAYTYSFQYGMNMQNNAMTGLLTCIPIFILAKLGGLDFVLGFPVVSIFIMYTVMGATMAYVIPMLPMVTFAVGVIGYFVTILQALFAAPLWVLGHAKPKADDFVGDKGHGYLLLSTLVLKPALMTIGVLYITPLVLKFGYVLTNKLFNYTVYLPDGVNSWPSIVFLLTISLITTTTQLALMRASCKVYIDFTDECLKWFGQGLQMSMGSYSASPEQAVMQAQSGVGQGLGLATALNSMGNRMFKNEKNNNPGSGSEPKEKGRSFNVADLELNNASEKANEAASVNVSSGTESSSSKSSSTTNDKTSSDKKSSEKMTPSEMLKKEDGKK